MQPFGGVSCSLPAAPFPGRFALVDFGSKDCLKLLGGYRSLLSSKGILKALRTLEQKTSAEKYPAPQCPTLLYLGKIFFLTLGASSCFTVRTTLCSITRRRGGEDKLGDTIQILLLKAGSCSGKSGFQV